MSAKALCSSWRDKINLDYFGFMQFCKVMGPIWARTEK